MEQAWSLRRRRDAEQVRCPLCHDALAETAVATECGDCRAAHHAECWAELERCASCQAVRAVAVSPPAPPEARTPTRCDRAGCARLATRSGNFPERCEPHGVEGIGFSIVCAAGMITPFLAFVAWVGAMDPSDRRFPMSLGLASFYYGVPIALLLIGLITLACGARAARATRPAPP